MRIAPPKIDPRNQEILVDQLKKLIKHYCPELSETIDTGEAQYAIALAHIFARMMETVIQRVNKVPDKNFLSFLDLIGISLTPPKVARAPLTFKMASGVNRYGFIPAGTQVAAAVKDQSVVFETNTDLTIILPQIIKVISIDTWKDEWNDHGSILTKNDPGEDPQELFVGKELIPRRLYLGHQKLFSYKEKVTINIKLSFPCEVSFRAEDLKWYCYTEDLAQPVKLLKSSGILYRDPGGSGIFIAQYTLNNVEGVAERTLQEYVSEVDGEPPGSWTNYWIFAQFALPLTQSVNAPLLSATASVSMNPPLNFGEGKITAEDCRIFGCQTSFTQDLRSGYQITALGQSKEIAEIVSDTVLITRTAFDPVLPQGTKFSISKTGTGRISSSGFNLYGKSSCFTHELKENFSITAASQTRIVTAVNSDSSVTIDYPFHPKLSGETEFMYSGVGTGKITYDKLIVRGSGTMFLSELKEGDTIKADNQARKIVAIQSDTELRVENNFSPETNNTPMNFTYQGTGTGTIIDGGPNIKGDTSTRFTAEIRPGDSITAAGQTRVVTSVNSDHSLTIDLPFYPRLPANTTYSYSRAGSGTIHNGVSLKGTASEFTTQLKKGDFITISGQARQVTDVHSDEVLEVNFPFNPKIAKDANDFTYTSSRVPDLIFYNHFLLDCTKDFYPFGERPKFNDTFYLGSKEVFSKQGALIKIMVSLSSGVSVPDTKDVSLDWEYWDGKRWVKMKTVISDGNVEEYQPSADTVHDSTGFFTRNGQILFICPLIEPTKVNNEENYWIRVRITGGNYGEEATYLETTLTDGSNKSAWVYKPATYKPPVISVLTMTYELTAVEERLEDIVSYNDFMYYDHSPYGQLFELRLETQQRALYIAFDQDIAALPVNLYFQLQRNLYSVVSEMEDPNITQAQTFSTPLSEVKPGLHYSADGSQSPGPPVITWEYWNGAVWRILNVEDGTENLSKREIVQFSAPADLKASVMFGRKHYWIRARLDGSYTAPPRLKAIYSNTVWAQNLITVRNEILGSSNGNPSQSFKLSNSPVLPGQKIIVRETTLTEAERKAIINEEGRDAIKENYDSAGNVTELWVRWHEVNDFYFSESNSRHYRIDRNSGVIIFGNAVRGMVPPVGKDNIRCSFYQYGGGAKGNVKEGTIIKLRAAIPYVDSVTNPTEAEGGFDQENLERAKIRGPQTIKHRDRAVTYEDFEWLIREASPKVAKVKCLSLSNEKEPGRIEIIVVPESENPKPLVNEELLAEIEEHLFKRTSGLLTENTRNMKPIKLIGPGYLQVSVKALVWVKEINSAKIILGKITDNLKKFFHPLYGGPEKQGWEFGRNVYISEVFEVIENTEGVDYVEELSLNAAIQSYRIGITIESSAIYPKKSTVKAVRPGGEVVLSLVEDLSRTLQEGEESAEITINVTGFKEGDLITLKNDQDGFIRLLVKQVTRGVFEQWVLECEPVGIRSGSITFPAGSVVESISAKSYLVEPIEVMNERCELKVASLEAGDKIIITHGQNFDSSGPLTIKTLTDQMETIFVDDNYLVYSGTHTILQAAGN